MNEPVRSPDTAGTRRPDTSSRWSLTSILVAMAAGAGLFASVSRLVQRRALLIHHRRIRSQMAHRVRSLIEGRRNR